LGKGVGHLFWSGVLFILSGWIWGLSIRLAPMPEPYKKIGVVVAFMSLGLFFWGIWKLWCVIREAGIWGFISLFGAAFLLLLIFNILTFSQPLPIQDRIFPALKTSGQQARGFLQDIASAVAKAPEDFRFAYVGGNAGAYLPGFPTPDPGMEPVLIDAAPARNSSVVLEPGGYAYIRSVDGISPDCFTGPGSEFPRSVPFRDGDRLLVLEGPKTGSRDNGLWWRLHGSQGDGWCREEILSPTR
jgi:hypothetical protein